MLCLLAIGAQAQQTDDTFSGELYNNDYEVSLNINLKESNVKVPRHELYGEVPGYLSKKGSSFCWIIVDAQVDGNSATLTLVNDYGSEDLTALLTLKDNSMYELKHLDGSTLKVANNGKWQKLPKVLPLYKKP